MKKVILKIDGMSCSACQNRVEKYLNKQDGVEASVNLVMAQALINYDEEKVSLDDLDRFVEESGYKSLGIYNEKEDIRVDNTKYYLIILLFVIILLMYISMSHMIGLPVIPFLHMINYPINYGVSLLLLTIPFLVFGFDIIKKGIKNIINRSPNMDSLVTVGVISSFVYSLVNLVLIILGNNMLVESLYFEGVAMIIYFIKLGRFIDKRSMEKTKSAISQLVQITPSYARLKDGSEVSIDEVKKGDILLCLQGEKIAVDGVIVKGDAHMDLAFITGESKTDKKIKGDKVVAGAINIDGLIEYKAERIGPDSTISNIVRLVMESVNSKAPIASIADKVSGYFVPGIFIIALITLISYLIFGNINDAIISFVTVLVVACPCALGLATPLAMVVSVGNAAKKGILIKSSEVLEKAKSIDTIIFDKTGTLTNGKLSISEIIRYSISEKELLKIVCSLEKNSTHPIAKTFIDYAKNNKLRLDEVTSFKTITGIGISGVINNKTYYIGNEKIFDLVNITDATTIDGIDISTGIPDYELDGLKNAGNSILCIVEDKKLIGLIGVKDTERDSAHATVTQLRTMGKRVIMLSGDNKKTANIVASKLGITEVYAEVMPDTKENILKELKNSGANIMMVGDGINDAPSLAFADIGVSFDSGTDIAADSSDVILMNDDLNNIVTLLKIGNKTIKIIKENLFWAFIYNLFMIPIAIGIIPFISISPMIASIAMTISSLCVVINSLRLRRIK